MRSEIGSQIGRNASAPPRAAPQFHWHQLRHTCGTALSESGASTAVIMAVFAAQGPGEHRPVHAHHALGHPAALEATAHVTAHMKSPKTEAA